MFRFPTARLLVFCKAPVPGQVKTRLRSRLSPQDSAALHVWLSLRILREVTRKCIAPIQLWCAPTTNHPFFVGCAESFPVTLHEQTGEDLGARMHFGFTSALKACTSAIIIGCDSPSLSIDEIEIAFNHLERGKELVITPAEDGGYVLIGLTKPQPDLFSGIPWGSPAVMAETELRIAKQGLESELLASQWDVDAPEDLDRLKNWVRANKEPEKIKIPAFLV